MRPLLLFLVLYLIGLSEISAQYSGISYQAVIRDSDGRIMSNKSVELEFQLIYSISRTAAYTERHKATTSEFGLINLTIGKGLPTFSDFDMILWEFDPVEIQVWLDDDGDNSFDFLSSIDPHAIPYAYHAETAVHAQTVENSDDADADPNNELQTLNISGDQLSISNGNSITLPTPGNNSWSLSGNSSTDPNSQFIGTTDAKAFNIHTNSKKRLTINEQGKAIFTGDSSTAHIEAASFLFGAQDLALSGGGTANGPGGQLLLDGGSGSSSYGNILIGSKSQSNVGIGTDKPTANLHLSNSSLGNQSLFHISSDVALLDRAMLTMDMPDNSSINSSFLAFGQGNEPKYTLYSDGTALHRGTIAVNSTYYHKMSLGDNLSSFDVFVDNHGSSHLALNAYYDGNWYKSSANEASFNLGMYQDTDQFKVQVQSSAENQWFDAVTVETSGEVFIPKLKVNDIEIARKTKYKSYVGHDLQPLYITNNYNTGEVKHADYRYYVEDGRLKIYSDFFTGLYERPVFAQSIDLDDGDVIKEISIDVVHFVLPNDDLYQFSLIRYDIDNLTQTIIDQTGSELARGLGKITYELSANETVDNSRYQYSIVMILGSKNDEYYYNSTKIKYE